MMENKQEEVNHKVPDYQVVIFIENESLGPLTESVPLCLLPVANRPLLYYQLDMLSKSGVLDIYIVTPSDYIGVLSQAIQDYKRHNYLPHMTSYSAPQRPWKIKLISMDTGDDNSKVLSSCDAIRACQKYIKNDSDLIFLNANFISQFSLSDIVNHHKMNLSDFTLLLSVHPSFSNNPNQNTNSSTPNALQQVKENIKYDFKAHDLYYISKTGRILSKTPSINYKSSFNSDQNSNSFIKANSIHKSSTPNNNKDDSESVKINRNMFSNIKNFSLRSDLSEVGIYILNSSIKELIFCDGDFSSSSSSSATIDANEVEFKFKSLNYHVLPYLLKRQWKSSKFLMNEIPSLKNRKNRKYQFNYAFQKTNFFDDIFDKKFNQLSDKNDEFEDDENKEEEELEQEDDPLRIFGFVYNPGYHYLISKVTNINSYINLNKELPLTNFTPRTPWSRVQNYIKKEGISFATLPHIGPQTPVAPTPAPTTSDLPPLPPSSELSDASPKVGKKGPKSEKPKVVQDAGKKDESLTKSFEEAMKLHKNAIKQTMIGSNVSIGSKSKINSSVIMNNVVIGENVIIQNCVISDGVVIENNCNLNDVHIGPNYKVNTLTKAKNETFSLNSNN